MKSNKRAAEIESTYDMYSPKTGKFGAGASATKTAKFGTISTKRCKEGNHIVDFSQLTSN